MIVLAHSDRLEVLDHDDFGRFHVDASSLTEDALADLIAAGVGLYPHADPGHVWVDVDLLVRELDLTSSARRQDGWTRMLAYASSKGWVDDHATRIAAHVERAAENQH